MQPLIKTHVHGPAGTIILNRPEKRNALSRALIAELQQALADMHQERRVRTVILTGAGNAFCAGMDLAEMAATSQSADPLPQWHQDALDYLDLVQNMLLFPKPLVAAVVGPALAGGCGLALACDIVVAGESPVRPARAAPRACGRCRGAAARVSHRCRPSRLFAADRPDHFRPSGPRQWAGARGHCRRQGLGPGGTNRRRLRGLRAESLQLTKRILNETIGERLSAELSVGASASATARTTEAAAEGLAAFLERREPKWP